MNDQLVAEAATCTTHRKHNRPTFMPSPAFEPVIQATKRRQTYTLDRTAAGIGIRPLHISLLLNSWWNAGTS